MYKTCREALQHMLGVVDYTNHCCSITAMIGAALDSCIIEEARAVLNREPQDAPCRPELLVLLDQCDFLNGACSFMERVGAVIPADVLARGRAALA